MISFNPAACEVYGNENEKYSVIVPEGWKFVERLCLSQAQQEAVNLRYDIPYLFLDSSGGYRYPNDTIENVRQKLGGNIFKINAIMAIRRNAACGLKEAKEAYEFVEGLSYNQIQLYGKGTT